MPPDSTDPNSPHHWLARAAGHLALARQPKPQAGFWEDLAFHAQQATELAIKAVYQHHGLVFRFTHDLEQLTDGLVGGGVIVPPAVRGAIKLTRYAVQARYPGAMAPVTQQEHEEACRLAAGVLDWAQAIVGGIPAA